MNKPYTTYINQLLDNKCTCHNHIHLQKRLITTTAKYKYHHDLEYITYNETIGKTLKNESYNSLPTNNILGQRPT